MQIFNEVQKNFLVEEFGITETDIARITFLRLNDYVEDPAWELYDEIAEECEWICVREYDKEIGRKAWSQKAHLANQITNILCSMVELAIT